MLRPLFVALQFLTLMPVRFEQAPTVEETRRSLLWYPVVGAWIGCLLLLTAQSLAWFAPGLPLVQAGLVLLVWVVLTGGLHLDGLADCADAWVGGRGERERTLRLLKDPSCGAMAAVALNLQLIVKFAAVTAIAERQALWILGLPPVLGRLALLPLFASMHYVRVGGLGATIAEHALSRTWWLVMVLSGLLVVGAFERYGAVACLTAAVVTVWIRSVAQKRLGGLTGDVAGATVELVETAVLMTGLIIQP